MDRQIVFDTETTGLSPNAGHRVIEIGCVELTGGGLSGSTFHRFINPERDVPDEAVAVHGIKTEHLLDKPVFADPSICEAFLGFIGDAELIAHNASFDLKFLNFELNRAGRPSLSNSVVDTLELARVKFPGAPNSLDALCKRFDISLASREKHGALIDSELLAHVYIELTGGRQPKLFVENRDAPGDAAQTQNSARKPARTRPKPLQSRLTDEERARHEAFISDFGVEPLWRTLAAKD